VNDIKEEARDKWISIFYALGIEIGPVNTHSKCPVCGGKDRFKMDSAETGAWYCNQCNPHAGSGIDLVMKVLNVDFKGAVEAVRSVIGKAEITKQQPEPKMSKSLLRKIYLESGPVSLNDPVSLYLKNRGLSVISEKLRYHPACYEPETRSKLPTMLATFMLADNTAITMHRTFLTKFGNKADIANPKKVLPALADMAGGAIRLFEPKEDGIIAIAEGIETALAVYELTNIPTWSVVSSALMEGFEPPKGIKHIMIFSDKDDNFTGQKSAYILANKLVVQRKKTAEVFLPKDSGDFLDELRRNKGFE